MEVAFYLGLFALGAVDALQPGHAKSLVSSCLVGSNAKVSHLIVLGLVVTVTHVLVNGTLAYGVVAFASAIFEDAHLRYIELVAGLLILGLAIYMLRRRFDGTGKPDCCGHGHHGHHEHVAPEGMPFWQIVTLGVTSGLTPCPVVLTALMSAINAGRGAEALLSVTVFSLGVAFVLFLVGLCTLLGLEKLNWLHRPENMLRLSRISAVMVLLLGGAMILKALFFHEVESEAPITLLMTTRSGK